MADLFKCVHCSDANESFNHKTLWRHYQNIHEFFKIECTLCENKFHRESDLVEHLEKFHQQVEMVKVIACVHCNGQTFTTESGLSEHYKVVHRKYTVPCGICQNRFLNKAQLKEHKDVVCLTWKRKG